MVDELKIKLEILGHFLIYKKKKIIINQKE